MNVASLRYAAIACAAVGVFAACSPLPGSSLDPVYLKVGSHSVAGATTPPPSAPTTSAPATSAPAPPATAAVPASGAGAWSGQYHDSRGSGQISLSLEQRDRVLSGTWKLRTGGGGPFNGAIAPDGRITFHMDDASSNCPGKFEGWAEVRGSSLVGAYHGQDCEGVITDGRLDVARR